jgi:multiple sugar transport system ATP-binding protein
MTMGDRIVVMRDGLVQQIDDPQSVYDKPANLFVAAFIGSPAMNLFDGALSEDGRAILLGSQRIELPEAVRAAHPGLAEFAGKPVGVGVRPEHLRADPRPGDQLLECGVTLVEALGSELLVHFAIDARRIKAEGTDEEEDTLDVTGAGVARTDPRTIITAGERRTFGINPAHLHFFSPEGGDAL